MKTSKSLVMPVLTCLFAALVSVGAYIAVPIPGTPVPMVLQNLFIILTALLLGPGWGTASILVYLTLGAIGLPVFSGGAGGLAVFVGPTGGYLAGYLVAAPVMGGIPLLGKRAWWKYAVAAVVGELLIYACGVSWLKANLSATWTKALAVGFLPFAIGDTIKVVVAVPLATRVAAWLEDYLEEGEARD